MDPLEFQAREKVRESPSLSEAHHCDPGALTEGKVCASCQRDASRDIASLGQQRSALLQVSTVAALQAGVRVVGKWPSRKGLEGTG